MHKRLRVKMSKQLNNKHVDIWVLFLTNYKISTCQNTQMSQDQTANMSNANMSKCLELDRLNIDLGFGQVPTP